MKRTIMMMRTKRILTMTKRLKMCVSWSGSINRLLTNSYRSLTQITTFPFADVVVARAVVARQQAASR